MFVKGEENPPYPVGILAGSSYDIGGVERHILLLVSYSDRKRFRFIVFAPPRFLELLSDLRLDNVKLVEWKMRTKCDLYAIWDLWTKLRSNEVKVLHIHDPRSGAVGRVVARILKIPVVYTVHLPPYYYVTRVRKRLYQLIEGILNKRFTSRVIYVSHSVREEALHAHLAPKSRSLVIENGIHLEKYTKRADRTAVRRVLNTPEEAVVFCFVGRLTEQKGIDVFLRAIKMLPGQSGAFRVWLVGDGPLRSELEQYVAKENLGSIVQFLGYRSDVPEILQASDVFVLPSRYEAMPISLLEAMAAGLPCVVTSVGDNAKIVEDGTTGIVVPPENPEALATALRKMLADSEMRQAMGEAARKKAQEYSVERMAARIAEVYEELLKRP
jgi:glycosyltransferase involved in cell wall biosynthesis